MHELTRRQEQTLRFIAERVATGVPPTFREIGDNMGITSTNGVNDHLRALERKGYIYRSALKSRCLRLTAKGAEFCGAKTPEYVGDPSRARLLERLFVVTQRWYENPTASPTGVFEAVREVMAYDNRKEVA